MKRNLPIFLVVYVIVFTLFLVMMIGCEMRKIAPPEFQEGDRVISVLSGEEGMIIKVHGCGDETCYYDVRFVGKQPRTETHILGRDDPMSISIPLVTVEWVREYELKKNDKIHLPR